MGNNCTLYLAGKITGDQNYKIKFAEARRKLEAAGFIVLDPSILPSSGFEYAAYIRISTAMMDECKRVCFLPDWRDSNGAMYEYGRAAAQGKAIFLYEDWARKNVPEVADGEQTT